MGGRFCFKGIGFTIGGYKYYREQVEGLDAMEGKKPTQNFSIIHLFLFYIFIQPIIDLATSLSIVYFENQFTIGTIIRFLMLALGIVLLLFNKNQDKKIIIIYQLILGGYFFVSLINNFMVKSPISIGAELTFIVKALYFIIVFFSYVFVFHSLKIKDPNWTNTIQKYIFYTMMLTGLIMLLAGITDTAFDSYKYSKLGHKGWFYAANELGSILAICFPVVMLYSIRKASSFKTLFYWIPSLLLLYSLFSIGTKVGLGTIIVTVVIGLIMTGYELIQRYNRRKKVLFVNLIVQLIIGVSALVYLPFSPVAENTQIHIGILDEEKNNQPDIDEQAEIDEENKSNEQIEQLILSNRDQFLEQQQAFFKESPFTQKLFGMGYGGNYEKKAKLIEMDFHDLFYSFGIIGFVIYIIPLIFTLISGAFRFISDLRRHFNLEIVLIWTGILLGLGIAFTAGHVLTAPGVSIYLAILLAYMNVRLKSNE